MPADFSKLDPQTRTLLENRYGIKPSKGRWRWVALLIALLGLPWLFWSAWHHSNPEIRYSVVSYRPIDSTSMEITFDINRKRPSQALLCTVIARDFDRNVVGERDLTIASSKETLIRQSARIPTRLPAVNADLLRCIAQ